MFQKKSLRKPNKKKLQKLKLRLSILKKKRTNGLSFQSIRIPKRRINLKERTKESNFPAKRITKKTRNQEIILKNSKLLMKESSEEREKDHQFFEANRHIFVYV